MAQGLGPEYELWLAFGTGKHFQYLAAHKIASGLGLRKAQALPMFHSLTGCDTVSSFVGHGKKTAWTTWNALTDALLKLFCAPCNIEEDDMQSIERFVILQYDRTSTCADIVKARRKLFAKKTDVKQIPPTRLDLSEQLCAHVKGTVH